MIRLSSILIKATIIIAIYAGVAIAHGNYTSEELFTVPWGDGEGEIPITWVNVDHLVWPPVPVAVSENAGIVINNTSPRLTKYAIDGSYIEVPFHKSPNFIAINNAGEVLCVVSSEQLHFYDTNLQHNWTALIDESYRYGAMGIYPSDDDNFWCVYSEIKGGIRRAYRVKVFTDGTISEPTLVFEAPTQEPVTCGYVSPDGTVSSLITDMYGYTYTIYRQWVDGKAIVNLAKRSPEGLVVYTDSFQNDPDCEGIPDYFIMHTGNYFTWHGSDDGMVLTKYTYHPPE